MNITMKVLAAATILITVPNMIFGFYGMNVKLPLQDTGFWALVIIFVIMVVFMATTSPTEITNAIEKSLGFLQKVGIPISTFALVLSISLRFIPTILEETNRIINAQVSRGSDFNEGNLAQKVRKFIPILIPLFIATLKRADELATAMEVRGYSTTGIRSKYKVLKYNNLDYLSYILIIVITILIIL